MSLSTTTAPSMNFPSGSETVPSTTRSVAASRFSFLVSGLVSCARAVMHNTGIQNDTAAMAAINLLPFILVLVFFLVGVVFVLIVVEIVVVIVVEIVVVLFGRQFKGRDAGNVQIGAALLAGQRVAFIQILFVDIDGGVT